MTDSEKISVLKSLAGIDDDSQDEALAVYLSLAADKIRAKAFPFGDGTEDFPKKYDMQQCDIACYLWNKRGAEGEISHDENGISRQYSSADVPSEMLRGVLPICSTPRNGGPGL